MSAQCKILSFPKTVQQYQHCRYIIFQSKFTLLWGLCNKLQKLFKTCCFCVFVMPRKSFFFDINYKQDIICSPKQTAIIHKDKSNFFCEKALFLKLDSIHTVGILEKRYDFIILQYKAYC
jgi:hypothetical protein